MTTNTEIYNLLEERGYIYQCTDFDAVKQMLSSGKPITFYLGIDPTADSLHIGHFFALMVFRYLQDAGHKGILVIGGATALIGDPSGKSDMRKMLTKEQVQHNMEEVKELAKHFIRTDGENPALILSNSEWINKYSYIDFMREIGQHFNVNKMLASEAYANRLAEGGLTFLEMGYMLMQAYDFAYLNETYGCTLQIGGSDQWGNIVAGTMLHRKREFLLGSTDSSFDIYGLTNPLLLTKEGKKMGKTETGTLWVARDKTTPYDFYQYFYNVNDNDVDTLLRLFTRVPLDEINNLIHNDIIKAKKLMAYEVTKLVHGQEEADKVITMINSLFTSNNTNVQAAAPTCTLSKNKLIAGYPVIEILVDCELAPTKSEARRLIAQGGVTINNEKVSDVYAVCTEKTLANDSLLIKKGKKAYKKAIFE